MPADLSTKILAQVKAQQAELQREADDAAPAPSPPRWDPTEDEVDALVEEDMDEGPCPPDDDGFDAYEDVTSSLSAADEAILASFMKPDEARKARTLADMIMEKFQENTTGIAEQAMDDTPVTMPDTKGDPAQGTLVDRSMTHENNTTYLSSIVRPVPLGIHEKVVDVYSKVGLLLSRYKSGKLPKAFKIIPQLHNWPDILYLTQPDNWTPHATYQATRIFASNMSPKMAKK